MWNLFWAVSLMLSWTSPSPSTAMNDDATTLADSSANLDSDRAAFGVAAGGELVPHRVMAVFVLPGESLPIEVTALDPGYVVEASAGTIESPAPNHWLWRAPERAGTYPVRVRRDDGAEVLLNAFVMVPYENMRRGMIGGYRIGAYPASGRRPGYERPRGFVEVTAANESTWVAPHFRLAQFLCKQGASYPKYVVLQPRLLNKLERLLERAHENGVEASTFELLSVYRTPLYNKKIGNTTSFSRHHYGDAADIFIDEFPKDGRMDDLDGDGRQSSKDARVLSGWAEEIERETAELVGGLSAYHATDSHGPFVHVDARGYAARW